jgi:hypothetical protein
MDRRSRTGAAAALALVGLVLTSCSAPPSPAVIRSTAVETAPPPPPPLGPTFLVGPGSATSLRTAADSAPTGRTLELSAGTYQVRDFLDAGDSTYNGASLPSRLHGLVGAGPAETVIEMAPRSSTRASTIPTAFPDTNQLSLLRIDQGAHLVAGFTLRATDQGHLYNGLRMSRTTDVDVRDVDVIGVPGSDSSPPGETFAINDYRTSGSRYTHVHVDGRQVGAAGLGANGSSDITVLDSTFENERYSHGATFYQVHDIDIAGTTTRRNGGVGLNFERVSGAVRIAGSAFTEDRAGDLRIASDRGSARFVISDPATGGRPLRIVLPRTYAGSPNLQRRSDVHVLVDGVDRTADLVRFISP